jgi:hypothetical protein
MALISNSLLETAWLTLDSAFPAHCRTHFGESIVTKPDHGKRYRGASAQGR